MIDFYVRIESGFGIYEQKIRTMTLWEKELFDKLCKVNHNIEIAGLPEKAREALLSLETSLCSGDGLTPGSAFRAKDEEGINRMVLLFGLNREHDEDSSCAGLQVVSVGENRFGVDKLYFQYA